MKEEDLPRKTMIKLQREKLLKQFAFYFAEKGYIPEWSEVAKDLNRPQKVKRHTIQKLFKSYSTLVTMVKKDYGDILKGTMPSAVDDAAEVMSKKDPLASLRASTTEK